MISELKYIILKIKQKAEWSSRKSQRSDFFISLSYTYYAEGIVVETTVFRILIAIFWRFR